MGIQLHYLSNLDSLEKLSTFLSLSSYLGRRVTALITVLSLLGFFLADKAWFKGITAFIALLFFGIFVYREKEEIWNLRLKVRALSSAVLNRIIGFIRWLTWKYFIGFLLGFILSIFLWPSVLQPAFKQLAYAASPELEVYSIEGAEGYITEGGYQKCDNSAYTECDGFKLYWGNEIGIFFKDRVPLISRFAVAYEIKPDYQTKSIWSPDKRRFLITPNKRYYARYYDDQYRFEENKTYRLKVDIPSLEPIEINFCLLPNEIDFGEDTRTCPEFTANSESFP